jgi:SAM-dependent methyltransferase
MEIANTDAAKAWDGYDGEHWTVHEEHYNASMRPHTSHLFAAAGITADDDVLDVGCGCGDTTRQAARTARSALGVDLSSRMLARATERAAVDGLSNVSFRRADAQVEPFAPVDVVISRFGVMFFADSLAAFANLRRSTRPGGRLAMLTWQSLERNAWLSTVRDSLAAGRELPLPPPGAPGPMSLADPDFVRDLLGRVGWSGVEFVDIAEPMYWGADLDEAMAFASTLGAARGLLADLDAATQAMALDALRSGLDRFAGPDGVLIDSRAWVITAHC